MYSISEARLNYLQLNPHGPVMSTLSQDARKAIFLALDKDAIVDFAWGSNELAEPANSLITPDQSIYNKDCKGYNFNLEEAKNLQNHLDWKEKNLHIFTIQTVQIWKL